jgi:agmatinase
MNKTLFSSPLTFLSLELSQDFANADVAILGIPFDCGRDPTRFGARLGPNAVRHASVLTANLMSDAKPSPLDSLKVVDAGNVKLSLEDINQAFTQIETAMSEILKANCLPITMGGDGAVSLPQMRALNKQHGEFAVLHFDAHTDAWPVEKSGDYTNANQFTFAASEKLIDMDASLHIGTRGPVNALAAIEFAQSLGYEVIPFEQVRQMGEQPLLQHLRRRIGERPVYVCFDMDFFDPSVAPGVATPTPGGAMPIEGIELLRGLKGLDIIGIDINTTSPIHDPSGATAALAASLLAESLGILAD